MKLRKFKDWWEEDGVWYTIGVGIGVGAIAVGYILGYSVGAEESTKNLISAIQGMASAGKEFES